MSQITNDICVVTPDFYKVKRTLTYCILSDNEVCERTSCVGCPIAEKKIGQTISTLTEKGVC